MVPVVKKSEKGTVNIAIDSRFVSSHEDMLLSVEVVVIFTCVFIFKMWCRVFYS